MKKLKLRQDLLPNNCACHKQIIWFFEHPTIIACENCERTFYYKVENCPKCGKETTEFIKKEEL
tara:strand:- start:959 stop:1150 length:192 start_codon:yes stop_codon:yes gene_type:complete